MGLPPNTRLITLDGETKTLAEWCREYRISKQLVIDRVKRGWDEETAITKPAAKYRDNQERQREEREADDTEDDWPEPW